MASFSIDQILKALRIYQFVDETPLDFAGQLSQKHNNNIHLKREDLHPIFSFKIRGACNKLLSLTDQQRSLGVVAASAGNHAQGVAYMASKLGVSATIVMPVFTPSIKVNAVREMGACVLLQGQDFTQSYQHAKECAKQAGASFLPPFDDLEVIAGQATVGIELIKQMQALDYVFLPIGGGGLAAGTSALLKNFFPNIKVIGVETSESPTYYQSVAAGKRIVLDSVGVFAEGVAVAQIGEHNFPLLLSHIDDVVLVEEDEVCTAIKDIFEQTRVVCEPSGALATAGMKKFIVKHGINNKSIVSVITGANMNFDRLVYIAGQSNLKDGGEMILSVTIPEEKGSFLKFVRLVSRYAIREFNYRFNNSAQAHIFVVLQLNNYAVDMPKVLNILNSKGYEAVNLTDDKVARFHIRHMIGGKIYSKLPERLYTFNFPERPEALLNFLEQLGKKWGVTLFHYRHQGSNHGRALIGFEVSSNTSDALLEEGLKKTGLTFEAVENNEAYNLFLS